MNYFLTVVDSERFCLQAYISFQNEPTAINYKLWKIHAQGFDEKIHIHQWQWSRAESQQLI